MKLFLIWILFIISVHSYIEFQLTRIPIASSKIPLVKSQCQDPKTVEQQTKYVELCFEKDISYATEFERNSKKYMLALDLTSPISWIKSDTCKIAGTNQKCQLFKQTLNQKLKRVLKHKINQLIKKLKMKIVDDEKDNAIIEGSNEVIMGSVQKVQNITVIGKNTDHVNRFLDMVLLGLYIIGQKDTISLKETTFIRAHQISPNLDSLCDGAISLRFDENSENSFLNELFKYVNTKEKIISVYFGEMVQLATIGSYSPKFMEKGIESLKRIKIQQDEKLGKLPKIQSIILQGADQQDNSMQVDSSVVFTLSSSYIAFPESAIHSFIDKFLVKPTVCKNTNYLQCTFKDKDSLQTFLESSINMDFDTSIVGFSVKDLVIHQQNKKVTFNIKTSLSNYTILGEPFFKKYYVYFDYQKNEIGFGDRALSIEESLIKTVTVIHFVVLLILFGICFILSSEQFRRIYYRIFQNMLQKFEPSLNRIKQAYKPIQNENSEFKQQKGTTLEDQIEGI